MAGLSKFIAAFRPENCGEGIFWLKISAVYQIFGQIPAKPELRKKLQH